MSGYLIKQALDNRIVLEPDKTAIFLYIFFAVGLTGLALAAVGRFNLIQYPQHLFYVFLGMGLIFFSGALIFLTGRIPSAIHIDGNTKQVHFVEGKNSLALPFSEFSGIMLSRKTHFDGGPHSRDQLHLKYFFGTLLIMESDNRESIKSAAETISRVLDLDVFENGVLIKEGKGNYPPVDFILPDTAGRNISKVITPGSATYRWHGRKSILTPILLAVMITGFNILIFKLALPSLQPGAFVGALIIVPLNLLICAILLFSLLGHHLVTVSPGLINYKQRFLGFNILNRSFTAGEIGRIQGGITGDENTIMIVKHRVLEIQKELEKMVSTGSISSNQSAFSLIPLIMEIKNSSIIIDGSALHFHDKLFLVSEWTRRLGLNTEKSPGEYGAE